MNYKISKLFRFISIYGPNRTLSKVLGRLQLSLSLPRKRKGKYAVSIIGCGQFAFSTICYFLRNYNKVYFDSCYDIDPKRAYCISKNYNFMHVADSVNAVIDRANLHTVYIASNHYSHSEYAINFLNQNVNVYIEKPISVDEVQLSKLLYSAAHSQAKVFAGYNRPFSQAVIDFKKKAENKGSISKVSPFTINCFISGHLISKDHWYRNPKEGLRVCGNIGHWLDLIIHFLNWRGPYPELLKIAISYSNDDEPDDNLSITITSDKNDLFTIVLSSRSEPFEGINETINIQIGNVTAKIDDFRKIVIWIDDYLFKKSYWPKDVGHKKAIRQPFNNKYCRDWHEVELSTLLMLSIKNMVVKKEIFGTYSINEASQIISAMRTGKGT